MTFGSAMSADPPWGNSEQVDCGHKKEYHNVPEVLDARQTKFGLEVKVRDTKFVHLVKMCAVKVNLMGFTKEEL